MQLMCRLDWAAWNDLVGSLSYVARFCRLGIETSSGICGILFCWGSIISSLVASMPTYVAGMLGWRDLLSWDWGISADLGSR